MQSAIQNTCTITIDHDGHSDEQTDSAEHASSGLRRWIDDALDWLDRYWDDPELRSGFWRSGW